MQSPENVEPPVDVAVIGLGLMGRSIAACLLAAGHRVIGITNDLTASAETPARVKEMLAQMHAEGLLHADAETVMNRFSMSAVIQNIASCGIVFESVTEDLALKREIVRQIRIRSRRYGYLRNQHIGDSSLRAPRGNQTSRTHSGHSLARAGARLSLHGDHPRQSDANGVRRQGRCACALMG